MSIGYPDWQRAPSAVGPNLFGTQDISVPVAGKSFGPYPVAGWRGVVLSVTPTAAYSKVAVQWWETSAMVNLLKADTWELPLESQLYVSMPAFGPYVQAAFSGSLAGTFTAVAALRGTSTAGPAMTYPVTGGGIDENGVSLAAGHTATYISPFIRAGQAFLSFNPYDTTGNLHVILLSVTGALAAKSTVAYFGTPTVASTWLTVVPAVALALQVVNVDASAAHQFDVRLAFS